MTVVHLRDIKPENVRIWLDPLPRIRWSYVKRGRRWHSEYGPSCIRCYGPSSYSEARVRAKLAKAIRREREKNWQRFRTKRESNVRRSR
jgi:hypothetical protein